MSAFDERGDLPQAVERDLDRMLAGWAARSALSSDLSERIRLQARSEPTVHAPLSPRWWHLVLSPGLEAVRSATRIRLATLPPGVAA